MQAPWRLGVLNSTKLGTPGLSFAEKMIQADLLLPVIAQDASRVADSLAAIGYTAGEQETTFATFWSLVDADLLPTPAELAGAGITIPQPTSGWTVFSAAHGMATSSALLVGPFVPTPIPVYMTVADILDWAQNLAGPSSTDQLREAGALGLNLLCDQADELFWLALAMLDPTASTQITALADTEVQLEVSSLATDLNTFANLAY
jgi:hypothetical protein